MRLLNILYTSNNSSQTILLLYIGETDDKIYGILSNTLNQIDKQKIKQNIQYLKTSAGVERLKWFKKNCAHSISKGFRTLFKAKIKITNEFEI